MAEPGGGLSCADIIARLFGCGKAGRDCRALGRSVVCDAMVSSWRGSGCARDGKYDHEAGGAATGGKREKPEAHMSGWWGGGGDGRRIPHFDGAVLSLRL